MDVAAFWTEKGKTELANLYRHSLEIPINTLEAALKTGKLLFMNFGGIRARSDKETAFFCRFTTKAPYSIWATCMPRRVMRSGLEWPWRHGGNCV